VFHSGFVIPSSFVIRASSFFCPLTSDLFLLSNFYFLISSRRQFRDDFLEAGIAAQWVPDREQF
jgi:hypothetical protein